MEQTKQKHLLLIKARELSNYVASAVFLIDTDGTLIYYNERAEQILGLRFEEAGELSAREWAGKWELRDGDGKTIATDDRPLMRVLRDHRPIHLPLHIRALDGIERFVEATMFPLFSRPDVVIGAVAIFWEHD